MKSVRKLVRERLRADQEGVENAGERGSGTILVLGGVALLLATGLLALALGGVAILRTRAASAADLAALAGASTALLGPQAACDRAADVAAANASRVESCEVIGTDVWVEVSMSTPAQLRRLLRAPPEARARAHAVLEAESRGMRGEGD